MLWPPNQLPVLVATCINPLECDGQETVSYKPSARQKEPWSGKSFQGLRFGSSQLQNTVSSSAPLSGFLGEDLVTSLWEGLPLRAWFVCE